MDKIKLKIYADLVVEASELKMLRETLCLAQNRFTTKESGHKNRIQELIYQIDKHRPLASNGKHGSLHTPTCGCEA